MTFKFGKNGSNGPFVFVQVTIEFVDRLSKFAEFDASYGVARANHDVESGFKQAAFVQGHENLALPFRFESEDARNESGGSIKPVREDPEKPGSCLGDDARDTGPFEEKSVRQEDSELNSWRVHGTVAGFETSTGLVAVLLAFCSASSIVPIM